MAKGSGVMSNLVLLTFEILTITTGLQRYALEPLKTQFMTPLRKLENSFGKLMYSLSLKL